MLDDLPYEQVSFSIISIITGIPSLFSYGLVGFAICSILCLDSSLIIRFVIVNWRASRHGMGLGGCRCVKLSTGHSRSHFLAKACFTMLVGLSMAGKYLLTSE